MYYWSVSVTALFFICPFFFFTASLSNFCYAAFFYIITLLFNVRPISFPNLCPHSVFQGSTHGNHREQDQSCMEDALRSKISEWCQKLHGPCKGVHFHDGEESSDTKVLCDGCILLAWVQPFLNTSANVCTLLSPIQTSPYCCTIFLLMLHPSILRWVCIYVYTLTFLICIRFSQFPLYHSVSCNRIM